VNRGGAVRLPRHPAPPHRSVRQPQTDDAVRRGALLDRYRAEIGRDPDPASVTRSIHLPVAYDRPAVTRDAIGEARGAGFRHIVLGLWAPYPADVARWVADELIGPSA
jgi:hypothetical protein